MRLEERGKRRGNQEKKRVKRKQLAREEKIRLKGRGRERARKGGGGEEFQINNIYAPISDIKMVHFHSFFFLESSILGQK